MDGEPVEVSDEQTIGDLADSMQEGEVRHITAAGKRWRIEKIATIQENGSVSEPEGRNE